MSESIFNHRWYRKLIPKEDGDKAALFHHHPPHTLLQTLLVSMKFDDKRYFTFFPSYVEFAAYERKFKPEYRCFFEIVLQEQAQKPRFDVECDLQPDTDLDWNAVITSLVDATLETLREWGVSPSLERDILLFSSHGERKRSSHLVVNNYCHQDNVEAKLFYDAVLARLPENHRQYLDPAVYSRTQQFRILGSQKQGSGRVKIFHETWTHHEQKITHHYVEQPLDEDYKKVLQLEESLLTTTHACQRITPPAALIEEQNNPKGSKEVSILDRHELSKEQAIQALELYASHVGCSYRDRRFPYRLIGCEGGIVQLKRVRPSRCPICARVHEKENPYLLVVGEEMKVYFHCRRAAQDKKYYVGKLSPQDSSGEESKKEEVSSWIASVCERHSPTSSIRQELSSLASNPQGVKQSKRKKPLRIEVPENFLSSIQDSIEW